MKTDSFDMVKKDWTRREVLAAGGAALLGLAGCGTQSVASTAHSSTATPTPTLARVSPTPTPEMPVTLAFTGDVMFGRTVNSHMLDTALNDPYPFTRACEKLFA